MTQQQCLTQITTTLPQILTLSGRFLNRMGQYKPCLENPQTLLYRWLLIHNPQPAPQQPSPIFNLGLCLPKQCTDEWVREQVDRGLGAVGLQVVSVESGFPGGGGPYPGLFWGWIGVVCGLVGLVVVASVMECMRSRNKHCTKPTNKYIAKISKIFSIQQTLKLFSYPPKSHPLHLFNGIKTYSTLWVVLSHQYFFNLTTASNSLTYFTYLLSPYFLLIEGGMLAVDVFLFVGGFFVGYLAMREGGVRTLGKVGLGVVGRVLRFWPGYVVAVVGFCGVLRYVGSGPNWYVVESQMGPCSHWWRSIFFLDNLINNGSQICMSWGWYLHLDIQLFTTTLLILYLCRNSQTAQTTILTILSLASLGFTFYLNYTHKFKQIIHLQDFGPDDTSFTDVYVKPWCRCAVYFYGVWYGSVYVRGCEEQKANKEGNENTKGTWVGRVNGWIRGSRRVGMAMQLIGLSMMLFVLLIPRTSQVGHLWSNLTNSLYLTLSKPLFITSLSLLIHPTLIDTPHRSSLLQHILINKFTHFTSKISFMMYLVHLFVILHYVGTIPVESYYSIVNLLSLYAGHVVVAGVGALVMVVFVEGPFGGLVKLGLGGVKGRVKGKGKKEELSSRVQSKQMKINE